MLTETRFFARGIPYPKRNGRENACGSVKRGRSKMRLHGYGRDEQCFPVLFG